MRQINFFLLTCALGFASCSQVLNGLYGLKTIKRVDEKNILHYAKKYNIPPSDCYVLDSSYISFLNTLDTILYKGQRQNHLQPLQALYFDSEGKLKSFQINCYAGGFPNLNWDRNEIMTSFPPRQQSPLDSVISLDTQLSFLRQLPQTQKFTNESYDYIVFVFWSRFMGRQSKRLIKIIQDNAKLASDKKVKIIYVNNDNVFSGQ